MRLLTPLLRAAIVAGVAGALLACGEDGAGGGAPPPGSTGATAALAAARFFRPPTDRIPHELATNPGTPWGDYLGSLSCKECHAVEYDKWRDSFHSRTLYDAVPKTVFGDFSGSVVFEDKEYPFTARPFRVGDKMYLDIGRNAASKLPEDTYGGGLPELRLGTFEVVYSFGNRRHQPYVTRAKDGRAWVLPVFWNDAHKEWRYDGWRPYIGCAQCHVTGIKFTAEEPSFHLEEQRRLGMTQPQRWTLSPSDEGWADGAVGCELCHGPGRKHDEAVRRMGAKAYRQYLADGGKRTIYDPKRDTRERRMQQCDMCHNFHFESSVTWVPTPEGYAHEPASVPLRPSPQNKGQFYDDGSPMSPCTVGAVFRGSKMGHRPEIECSTCHDPHGNRDWAELVLPIARNELCLKCHSDRFPDAAALARHTRHRADSSGSMCVECHMPRDKRFTNGVQIMSDHVYSHAFSVPRGNETSNGPPSACVVCHTDEDGAWVRATLKTWKAASEPPK